VKAPHLQHPLSQKNYFLRGSEFLLRNFKSFKRLT
jgi:hypothetical protein